MSKLKMPKEIRQIIRIIKTSPYGTAFYGNTLKPRYVESVCEHCGRGIFYQYIYIINKLKEAGLLDKSYPSLCCNCYAKEKEHARNNR